MKIQTLTLKNFRKFQNETFKFDEGLNVISGKNESGKSTIMLALRYAMFADPTTRSKTTLEEIKSWSKNNQEMPLPIIEVDFVHGKAQYFLRKDFENRTTLLRSTAQGANEILDIKEINEKLAEYLGIDSNEVYESTGSISQEDILQIRKSKSLLSAIQNAASTSGHDGDAQIELKKLDADIALLQKGITAAAKNPGPIKICQDEIEKAKLDLMNIKSKWENNTSQSNKLDGDQNRLQEVKEQVKNLELLMENQQKYENAHLKLQQNKEMLERITRDISQVEEFQRQTTQIKISLDKYKILENENLDSLMKKLGQIDEDIRLRRETLNQIQVEINLEEEKKQSRKKFILLYLSVAILIISSVLSFAIKNYAILIVGIFTALILLGIFVYTTIFSQKRNSLNKLKTKYTDLSEVLKNDEQKLEEFLAKYKMETKEQFYIAKGTIIGQKSNMQQIKAAMEGILGGKKLEDLKNDQMKLIIVKKEIETNELSIDIQRSKLPPDEYLKKRRELDMLRMEERRLSEEVTVARTRITDLNISLEDIGIKELEVENLEHKLHDLKHKLEVFKKVRDYIQKAVSDTSTIAGQIVKKDIEKYLPIITAGRYTQARINKDLDIEVFSKEKDEWINPINKLSSGTVDQLFFLIRLAFLQLISKDKHPFILLDDPFLTFDKSRFEGGIKMLEQLSTDYQIFYFTHSEEKAKFGYMNKI